MENANGFALNGLADGALVVTRLDELFADDWSFSVLEHREAETGATLVRGRLTVLRRLRHEAFGRSDGGYADAATDALLRCAATLGVYTKCSQEIP